MYATAQTVYTDGRDTSIVGYGAVLQAATAPSKQGVCMTARPAYTLTCIAMLAMALSAAGAHAAE
ncbi:MAG: hypothetical protein WAL83_04235, partial [Arenicellales bacterium]